MPSPGSRPAQRGFTFLEIVIVVVILGIVLAIAVPSYVGMVNGSRLTATANELLASMQAARLEAIRRNQRVAICPSTNGTTCGGDWSNGWLVFEDFNRDNDLDNGEPVISTAVPTALTQVLPSPAIEAVDAIGFGADGFARNTAGQLVNARFSVCRAVNRPEENVRDVILAAGSRVSIVRRAAAAQCNSPTDS